MIKEDKTMKTVYIEGMMCEHCKAHVQKALDSIGCDAKVDLENNLAMVRCDIPDSKIRHAVSEAGYKVTQIK